MEINTQFIDAGKIQQSQGTTPTTEIEKTVVDKPKEVPDKSQQLQKLGKSVSGFKVGKDDK